MTTSANKPASPRHFSMIRGFHLADIFTLGNAACGFAAVLMAMRSVATGRVDDLLIAAAFAPAAFVFDVLDGRIARWRQTSSALGRELDSLADVISFGVAPAALAFACGARGGWDAVVLVYFVCCGVSRLARYNVTAESMSADTGKVTYFEGTPIPTSVVLTAVLAWAAWQGWVGERLWGGTWSIANVELHPLVLLFALSGSLMISRIRIPKI
jgi:CDP-diacylglycerol--serine O-phosphatidyltransferase